MKKSVQLANSDVPMFEIQVEGKRIPDTIGIRSLKVLEGAGQVAQAEFAVVIGDSMPYDELMAFQEVFKEGCAIEIRMGYDSKLKTAFKGTMVSFRIKWGGYSAGLMLVSCEGSEVKLETPYSALNEAAYCIVEQETITSDLTMASVKAKHPDTYYGQLTVRGTPLLEVDTLIEVNYFIDTSTRKGYVEHLEHVFEEGLWNTVLGLRD